MPLASPSDLDAFQRVLPFRAVTNERRLEFVVPPDDLDYARPFWHMTMETLEAADRRGELDKVSVSFDELRTLVGNVAPRPAGMIFHIGRCGSTLVSRIVGHDPERFVVREAGTIGALHRASGGSDRVPTFTLEQAFKDTLVTFDRFAAARGQRVIVKHSSWESFSMGRVAELLPDTPMVFVFRNPIETVESSLDGHPGWATRLFEPRPLLQRWAPPLDRISPPFTAAAIYASVWAAGAAAALSLPDDRVLLVDHAELSSNPQPIIDQLVVHLGLAVDREGATGELGQYSKAKDDGTTFDPAGRHAHPPLSARTRAQVLDIVGDLPQQLASRLTRQDDRLSTTVEPTQGAMQ